MTGGANLQQAVPFFAVTDMEASVRHYVDGLGFAITKRWEPDGSLRWCWLERDGVALMLQQFPREGRDSWVPAGKVGEGVTIYVLCEDALALYREVTARGIDATRPFVGNGMWVTTARDPDGYRIDFESRTDTPEHTEYAG
jgi:catechol 2,3-dioxygenase-like lactoylglutathione lyase family enzyme